MSRMTWHAMTRIERDLLQLAEDARRSYHNAKHGEWATITAALTRLVGPLGDNAKLRRKEHYQVARDHLQKVYTTGNGSWQPPTDSWEADDARHQADGYTPRSGSSAAVSSR